MADFTTQFAQLDATDKSLVATIAIMIRASRAPHLGSEQRVDLVAKALNLFKLRSGVELLTSMLETSPHPFDKAGADAIRLLALHLLDDVESEARQLHNLLEILKPDSA